MLQVREVKKELVIVISTDKGLAGALNTNLLREAAQFEASKTVYVVAGRKARQFLARTKRELLADFELKDAPTFVETKPIAKFCDRKISQLEKSTRFRWFTPILSTRSIRSRRCRRFCRLADSRCSFRRTSRQPASDPMLGYIFEPNAEGVLDVMLPYYLQYQIFQMILDARASEHSARMVAMKNATDNANQFIKDLTLEYNKMRQASITTELLEIATAQMALGQ